ncbi:MAG: nucleoside 2-deoxyribosyltransferase [Sedimentisphaerales bacterium]|nr:nucleoside 2-deoxyribosyltransferase [Sedimentisphaerales bacterium]
MEKACQRVYCAGPLFNPAEREEMAAIASALKDGGYSVFLPQEDGLKFAVLLPVLMDRGVSIGEATKILNLAIFSLDVFEIMRCDGLLLNMNGRVPDEGAMVEAGIAWSHDKTIVIFKSDDRSLIHGTCNPLVMGLADFEFVGAYEEIPRAFDRRIAETESANRASSSSRFETANEKGEAISRCLGRRGSPEDITEILIRLFAEKSCLSREEQSESFSPVLGQQ